MSVGSDPFPGPCDQAIEAKVAISSITAVVEYTLESSATENEGSVDVTLTGNTSYSQSITWNRIPYVLGTTPGANEFFCTQSGCCDDGWGITYGVPSNFPTQAGASNWSCDNPGTNFNGPESLSGTSDVPAFGGPPDVNPSGVRFDTQVGGIPAHYTFGISGCGDSGMIQLDCIGNGQRILIEQAFSDPMNPFGTFTYDETTTGIHPDAPCSTVTHGSVTIA